MHSGKIQVQNILIPNGTAALLQEFRVTLDSEFDLCDGYYLIENINGGGIIYQVGLKSDDKTYSDIVNKTHFQASTNFEVVKRWNSETPFKTKGKTVVVTVKTLAATTADLNIDFLFRLKKEADCETK